MKKNLASILIFLFLGQTCLVRAQEKAPAENQSSGKWVQKEGILENFLGPGDGEFICYNKVHRNFFSGIFILVAALALVIYARYRVKKKMGEQLSAKNLIIAEKNKDITDSIHYARRIQHVLMAPRALLVKNLPEHFVLYKPKDIVSGDFYWAMKTDKQFLLCTADCTGHGVPGAFMSLLSICILNDAVLKKKIASPELILNQAREDIIKTLNPEGTSEEGKDGMDAVLCSFDFDNMKLTCAASNNPVWIVRNSTQQGTPELIECKADKFPVGMHMADVKPFTRHEVELKKGDVVYTFSDGYADQLGGPNGKKFKTGEFRRLLLSLSSKPLELQKESLDRTLEQWKGGLEQLDDILVVGVRV